MRLRREVSGRLPSGTRANGTFSRLGGRLVVVAWAAVCAVMVSVQVVQPPASTETGAVSIAPVEAGVPALRVGMSSWAASAEGDETVVTVVAGDRWQAVSDQDWLQVAGVEGGLVLTAEPNTGGLRTATVVVTSGRESVTVAVVQGNPAVGGATVDTEAPQVPGHDPAGPADGAPAAGPTEPYGAVDGTLGTPSRVTGWIVDPADQNRAVRYRVVVSFVKYEPGSTTRKSVLDGWGTADRPVPGVGNHGFTYTIVNTEPGGSLVSACVYVDDAPQVLVGCWYPA